MSFNPDKKVRVISTSSFAHMASPKFDFGAIKEGPGRKKYSTFDLYGLSKLVRIFRDFSWPVSFDSLIGKRPFRERISA